MIIAMLMTIRTSNSFQVIPAVTGTTTIGASQTSCWTKATRTPTVSQHPTIGMDHPRWHVTSKPQREHSARRIVISAQIHDDHHHHDESCHIHCDCNANRGMDHDPSSTMKRRDVVRNALIQWWDRFDVIRTIQVLSKNNIHHSNAMDTHNNNQHTILTAGIGGGLFGTIKKLHNPIVYFLLGIMAGFRYDWCFRSPVYWFAIGFTIKWYRARYVFKIPVWDRQPNWNNIITSKEQEKDLKAFTCKNCGSTIFIAKTREFFFEGNTGIGGLGCFSCGARGKENFIMDRERIVEDVGDMDDYFEYERPLDFVSRAERRKLLKEAQGDEDKANLLLVERTTGMSSSTSSTATTNVSPEIVDAVIEDSDFGDAIVSMDEATIDSELLEVPQLLNEETSSTVGGDEFASDSEENVSFRDESLVNGETVPAIFHERQPDDDNSKSMTAKPPKETSNKASTSPKKSTSSPGLDGLDELDMDAW